MLVKAIDDEKRAGIRCALKVQKDKLYQGVDLPNGVIKMVKSLLLPLNVVYSLGIKWLVVMAVIKGGI